MLEGELALFRIFVLSNGINRATARWVSDLFNQECDNIAKLTAHSLVGREKSEKFNIWCVNPPTLREGTQSSAFV